MILYHGSYVGVNKPDLSYSRRNVDFGCGFYTTPLYEQALKWCGKFKRREQDGIISKCELDETVFVEKNIMRFESYSEEWLEFILNRRRGNDTTDYDVVIGGVASDKVFNTVELYFDGLIDKTEALKRLQYEKPNLQVCLRTQEVLDQYLTFEGSEMV